MRALQDLTRLWQSMTSLFGRIDQAVGAVNESEIRGKAMADITLMLPLVAEEEIISARSERNGWSALNQG